MVIGGYHPPGPILSHTHYLNTYKDLPSPYNPPVLLAYLALPLGM